jgi:hypothetical protein
MLGVPHVSMKLQYLETVSHRSCIPAVLNDSFEYSRCSLHDLGFLIDVALHSCDVPVEWII